jgi:hypothetical protein
MRIGRLTTRLRSTATTRSGAHSTTTTGRRSTSSTQAGASATSTSAKDATSNPSASSRSCSASSASSPPWKGSAWRRKTTGTNCAPPRPISATDAAMASRHRTDSHSTNGTLRAPESLGFNSWALAGEWTIGREQFVLDGPGAASPTASTRANAHLVLSPGAREAIPFRVLSTARLRACHTAWTWTRTGTACSGRAASTTRAAARRSP